MLRLSTIIVDEAATLLLLKLEYLYGCDFTVAASRKPVIKTAIYFIKVKGKLQRKILIHKIAAFNCNYVR